MMDSPQSGHSIQFQFNGKAGEYFKIWIVNIMLSIITLGIYSPWAKVRTRRYFYGNTTLDGSSFDYLGDPLAILKGRMIVFAFILVYALSIQYIPLLELAFVIIYMIALPWMVIKSMQFNTRNSAYRNIRFNFDGKLGEAAFIFIFLSFLSLLTLGLAVPYFVKRFKQFSVAHSYFGTSKFNFGATTGNFYMLYLKAILLPMLIAFIIGILAAIAVPAYHGYVTASKLQLDPEQQTGQQQHEPGQNAEDMVAQGDANDQTAAQPAEDNCLPQPSTPEPAPGQCTSYPGKAEFHAASLIPMLIMMSFYLLLIVYIQTRTLNLVINNTTLDAHKLQSSLRVRDMFALYFTNTIAAIISLGLLIPWAKIRITRYRFAHTAFIAEGDLSGFIAAQPESVSATGGEFTEAFDVDLGF